MIGTEGHHYIVEASFCDEKILRDVRKLRDIFIKAAKEANMTIKGDFFFNFNGEGVSGTVIVAESHLSIHTWPEEGYAAIDVYTCGDGIPEKAVDYILKEIKAKKAHISEIKRGIKEEDGFTHSIITWEE